MFSLLGLTRSMEPQLLLEISTRPYLYKLSQTLGKTIKSVRDIPDSEFKSWKEKGYQWVWFMGIWELGAKGLEHDRTDAGLKSSYSKVLPGWTNDDVIGSPYAIVNYNVNPAVGTESDLKWLRQKLASYGMKLMIDFVPNHSAIDCPYVTSKSNYYIRNVQGKPLDKRRFMDNGIAYGCGQWCDPWTDVAQFNYFDPELINERVETLKKIGGLADGVRCDMAHLVLNDKFGEYWKAELEGWGYSKPSEEFWHKAISAVKKLYPNFIFLGEAYSDTLQALVSNGFDYVYDKDPLDDLYNHDVNAFKNHIKNNMDHMAHFTENHDEERTVGKFWDWTPAAMAAEAALLTLPGLRFMFQDQWDGPKNKLDVHLRRAAPESPRSDIQAFFQRLFPVLNMETLKKGTYTVLNTNGASTILAWKWVHGNDHVLVTVNFAQDGASGRIVLDDAPTQSSTIKVKELFSGAIYDRNPQELRTSGLGVVLDQYQVQIFQY